MLMSRVKPRVAGTHLASIGSLISSSAVPLAEEAITEVASDGRGFFGRPCTMWLTRAIASKREMIILG